jgi:S-DNA-T family DNA segregation ATPase FtsK/SpoIIIE
VFLGPTMLAFALMGPVVMVGNALSDRWGARRTYAAELRTHATLLEDAQARVDDACAAESRAARQVHPDPAALLALTSAPGDRLWERGSTDGDLLTVTVGRCTRAAAVRVIRPPGDARPEHPLLHDAPCTVPLDVVGVLGVAGEAASCRSVARHLVGQLVSLVSPLELELVVVTADGEATEEWSWLLRLPHLRTADGGRRPGASGTTSPTRGPEDTARSCLAALADTVRTRQVERRVLGVGRGPGRAPCSWSTASRGSAGLRSSGWSSPTDLRSGW